MGKTKKTTSTTTTTTQQSNETHKLITIAETINASIANNNAQKHVANFTINAEKHGIDLSTAYSIDQLDDDQTAALTDQIQNKTLEIMKGMAAQKSAAALNHYIELKDLKQLDALIKDPSDAAFNLDSEMIRLLENIKANGDDYIELFKERVVSLNPKLVLIKNTEEMASAIAQSEISHLYEALSKIIPILVSEIILDTISTAKHKSTISDAILTYDTSDEEESEDTEFSDLPDTPLRISDTSSELSDTTLVIPKTPNNSLVDSLSDSDKGTESDDGSSEILEVETDTTTDEYTKQDDLDMIKIEYVTDSDSESNSNSNRAVFEYLDDSSSETISGRAVYVNIDGRLAEGETLIVEPLSDSEDEVEFIGEAFVSA